MNNGWFIDQVHTACEAAWQWFSNHFDNFMNSMVGKVCELGGAMAQGCSNSIGSFSRSISDAMAPSPVASVKVSPEPTVERSPEPTLGGLSPESKAVMADLIASADLSGQSGGMVCEDFGEFVTFDPQSMGCASPISIAHSQPRAFSLSL